MSNLFYTQEVTADVLVNVFFLYSFVGWIMECIKIRQEKGFWENRGFVHCPLCIIYGFGAMAGYALLKPLANNYFLLYVAGALGATIFEYLTARLMQRLFGEFWWDYTNKRCNYRGMICLESTLAWGALMIFVVHFLQGFMFRIVLRMSSRVSRTVACLLVVVYSVDFFTSLHHALRSRNQDENEGKEETAS